jgi:hypothetical protein
MITGGPQGRMQRLGSVLAYHAQPTQACLPVSRQLNRPRVADGAGGTRTSDPHTARMITIASQHDTRADMSPERPRLILIDADHFHPGTLRPRFSILGCDHDRDHVQCGDRRDDPSAGIRVSHQLQTLPASIGPAKIQAQAERASGHVMARRYRPQRRRPPRHRPSATPAPPRGDRRRPGHSDGRPPPVASAG